VVDSNAAPRGERIPTFLSALHSLFGRAEGTVKSSLVKMAAPLQSDLFVCVGGEPHPSDSTLSPTCNSSRGHADSLCTCRLADGTVVGSERPRSYPRRLVPPKTVSLAQHSALEIVSRGQLAEMRTPYRSESCSDVVNRGLGGYNTDWGLEAFKRVGPELSLLAEEWAEGKVLTYKTRSARTRAQWFPRKEENRQSKIQLMTIWWGANDATLPGQTQHVPLDRFRSNIREMVSLVRDEPASPYYSPETSIILINAPSFYPEHWLDERVKKGLPREHDRDLEVTRRYAEEVKSLGEELGVPVADAYAAIAREVERVGEDDPTAIWSDGLHLTSTSYAAVTKGELPSWRPRRLGSLC
jgi:lysophospholipase L1-like esterase